MAVSILKFDIYHLPKMNYSSTPPIGLDTWGLDPLDYRLNQDLHLMRRYPSPLTHFGLGSKVNKLKKVMNILKNKLFYKFSF